MEHVIKHIVISGGGTAGLSFYGALRETHKEGLWTLDNIASLHGISIGAFLCVLLCLNYEWSEIDDFLIKRPWHKVFKFNIYTIMNSFQKRGIYDIQIIEETILPLFSGKDVDINVTLREFYERFPFDLHIYATETQSYQLVDFSHKTHPDWRVIDVIYCSCCVPIVFSPFLCADACYCDGALCTNYPLKSCIDHGANPDEILGIKVQFDHSNQIKMGAESSLFDYIIYLFNKLIENRVIAPVEPPISYQIIMKSTHVFAYDAYYVLSSPEERARLIEYGAKHWNNGTLGPNLKTSPTVF